MADLTVPSRISRRSAGSGRAGPCRRSSTATAAPMPPASARTRSPASGSSRGAGKIIVNDKEFTDYFARPVLQMILQQPILAANRDGQYDVRATVSGGGLSGQAGAVRHGISKALTYYEPELRGVLKKGGFLTRDSRVVERKKYGKRKARRASSSPSARARIRNRITEGRADGPPFSFAALPLS